MTLSASLAIRLQVTQSEALDQSVRTDLINKLIEQAFADGTGADQANKAWSDSRTLADGASETLDLYGGLTDAFGATINFTKIKLLLIASRAANTTILSVGAAAAPLANLLGDAASDLLKIHPGGVHLTLAPQATAIGVTATSADGLKIANAAGAAATYDIFIVGTV